MTNLVTLPVTNNKFLSIFIVMDLKKYLLRRSAARCLVALAMLLSAAFPMMSADVNLVSVREKAERFYAYKEWANALAMFRVILSETPGDMQAYGRSVAVYGILGNREEQEELLERTQSYGLPLDKLFEEVRKSAFENGEPQVLEEFMLLVKERQPWMKRNIDLRLARYYDFRNNAPKMIAQSDSLLAVNPDDPEMLRIKARGYMLSDGYQESVALYERILELCPEDTDAMLNIGIYYYNEVAERNLPLDSGEAEEARKYLSQAFRLKPTAHLRTLLSRLK